MRHLLLVLLLLPSLASAQTFVRWIPPPNVLSLYETTGGLTMSMPFLFSDGSSSAPSIAFSSSPTTGFYLGKSGSDLAVSDKYGNTLAGNTILNNPPTCDWSEVGCAGITFASAFSHAAATTYELTRGAYVILDGSGTVPAGRFSHGTGFDVDLSTTGTGWNSSNGYLIMTGLQSRVGASVGKPWLIEGLNSISEIETNVGYLATGARLSASQLSSTTIDEINGVRAVLFLEDTAAQTTRAAALHVQGVTQATDGADATKVFKIYANLYGRSLIDQPRDTDYALELTNGKGLLVTGKTNQLQLAKAAGGAKPTCDSAARGSFWYEAGGPGVADTMEVCRKDGANAYAWVSVY